MSEITAVNALFGARQGETPLDYMLSFSPFAPIFGVSPRLPYFLVCPATPAKYAEDQPSAKADAIAETLASDAVEEPAPVVELRPAEEPQPVAQETTAAPEQDVAAPQIDDLKVISGIGPKMEERLNGLGITSYAQIAAFTDDDFVALDEKIETLRGRGLRDDWRGQAAKLV